MHDLLRKPELARSHVSFLLRDGRPAPRPNRKFRFGMKNNSPIREFARERFRESLAGMLRGAYRIQHTLPDEEI